MLAAVAVAASCATSPRAADPPVAPGDTAAAAGAAATRHGAYSDADVRFLQMMLVHHAQALEMAALVPARTERVDVRMAAGRIEAAQRDEMQLMERWLAERGHPSASPHVHHDAAHLASMGMLTRAELDRLAASRDVEFDRLFLDYMIRHHEGAVTMVRDLFATPGAAQDPEIYQIASHVDADQRAEIDRMRRMQQGTLQ